MTKILISLRLSILMFVIPLSMNQTGISHARESTILAINSQPARVKQMPSEGMPERSYENFTRRCLEKESLSAEQQHTINVLLRTVGDENCAIASANLFKLTELDLLESEIKNLEPLQDLTNLTLLDLSENQINNLEPLQNLTNLTLLRLNDNPLTSCPESLPETILKACKSAL
jgi:Leucine-rich repeat (LRR) protein